MLPLKHGELAVSPTFHKVNLQTLLQCSKSADGSIFSLTEIANKAGRLPVSNHFHFLAPGR